jgi:methionyl-tRNA formyltransferase
MKVLHAGEGPLAAAVLPHLEHAGDEVESVQDLRGLEDAIADGEVEWLVSAGFRHLVPQEVLDSVASSCNVHTSFLPWGRGAHPNVWAIAHDEPAGVTVHRMVAGLDRGPILAQRAVPFDFADTASTLHARLVEEAGRLFGEVWPELRTGDVADRPQPDGGSYHRAADLQALGILDPDERLTWREALDRLRALTFPPHRNTTITIDGRRYQIDVTITPGDLGGGPRPEA